MIISKANNYKANVVALLATEKLPVADLPEHLDNFLVALEHGELIGVAGMEIYGQSALLRSVAVQPSDRNKGVGEKLLHRIEDLARSRGINAIYLLTETASGYFIKKNYQQITRNKVPDDVLGSTEFSFVCPQSAIVMKKIL